MLLHLAAKLGDEPLSFLGKQLREREVGDALHHRGAEYGQDQRYQQLYSPLQDDVVKQKFQRGRQHQAGKAIDRHQPKPQRQELPARADEDPDMREQFAERPGFLGFSVGCHDFQSLAPSRRKSLSQSEVCASTWLSVFDKRGRIYPCRKKAEYKKAFRPWGMRLQRLKPDLSPAPPRHA